MIGIFKKLFSIVDKKEKLHLYFFFIILILFALFDSFSLALIIPLMELMISFEDGIQNETLINIFNFFELPTYGISMLYYVLTIFFVISLLKAVTQVVVYRMTAFIPYKILFNKSLSLIDIYTKMSWEKFITLNSNDLIKTITKSNELNAYAYVVLLQFFTSVVVTIFLFSLLFIFNPVFTLSASIFLVLISFIIVKYIRPVQQKGGEDREDALSNIFIHASELMLSMQEIRILNSTSFFRKKFLKDASQLSNAFKVTTFYPPVPNVIIEIIAVAISMMIFLYILNSDIDFVSLFPSFVFIVAVARRLLPSVSQINSHFITLKGLEPSINIIKEELSKKEYDGFEGALKTKLEKKHKDWSEIKITNLDFSYNSKKVLRSLNVNIIRGNSIAFVGSSGAGKTTLMNVLLGLLKPDQGEIYFDNKLSDSFNSLNNNVGLVPQIINIIDDTIENNIVFGRTYDEEKLKRSIKISNLNEVLNGLDNGLDTILGERGISLSGGQRQRVAIARAIYNDPDLIIFDEATSSLDNISEKIIKTTISELSKHKTIISIAHRMSSIRDFDVIHVLEEGKIVSSGDYDYLIKNSDLFRKLTDSELN